jgi:phenylacetate-CoA ligase
MEVFRAWFGWTPSSKVAYLWGAALDIPDLGSWKYRVRSRYVERRLYLLAAKLNASIMDHYADRLDAFAPDILQAYSNPAHLLAAHLLATGRKVRPPRAVIVTAEPCTEAQRVMIAEAFRCPVYSFYGAREAGYIATQCPEAGRYHVNTHGLCLEIVREGHPVPAGEMGHVLLTDLLNLAMPLIRYQIGDLAALSPEACPCGRALPVLEFFAGRETDVFVTPEGDLVPGVSLCDRVVTECAGFSQLQFVQDVPEALTVKMVKGPRYSERDMRILDEVLRDYFGGRLAIEKVFVEDIPRAASGKTRFCISNVPVPLLGERG